MKATKGVGLLAGFLLLAPAPAAQALSRQYDVNPIRCVAGIKVFNTNAAGQFSATDGRLIAFHSDEGIVGQDLNGDTLVTPGMQVIRYYVIATGAVVNTGQSGIHPSVWRGKIAFVRWETNGGIPVDWNGDGDFQDYLIAYHDRATGVSVDTLVDGRYPDLHKDDIAFYTYESSVGPLPGTDLNGDGDMQDPVVRYYTISTGLLSNTMSAGVDPSISGDTIVFSSWETHCWNGAGATEPGVPNPPDLNADGDLGDWIIRHHSISAAATSSTGADGIRPTVDGRNLAFGFDENQTLPDPPVDADCDVDTIDLVLQLHDLNAASTTNAMLPITSTPTIDGRFVAFDLEEIYLGYSLLPAQGTELTGNGFPGDHVVCYYDRQKGAFTSTAVAGFCDSGDSLAGNLIAYDDQLTGLVGFIVFR
jgi:hypothetical protein